MAEEMVLSHRPGVPRNEVLSEAELEELAQRKPPSKTSVRGCLQKARCSASTAKSLLFRFLPILRWLPRYPVKDWLLGDIASGFSVGIMHLPQGLAYALLAGLPPVTGLYSSFYPVFLYFFFGTSRHNSVGPFAVISVMIGSVTESLLPSEDFLVSVDGGNTTIVDEKARDAARVDLVATITILSGIFQVALGLLQFGFVVTYLSDPLVRGYTTAASVHVLISQLKNVFGVSVGEYSGPLSLFKTFIEICKKLPQTNVGTLVTSIIAMLAIFIVKELNHKFSSKLPMPIPIELITVPRAVPAPRGDADVARGWCHHPWVALSPVGLAGVGQDALVGWVPGHASPPSPAPRSPSRDTLPHPSLPHRSSSPPASPTAST